MDKEALNEKLMQGIRFGEDDLRMNKQGVLTPAQIEVLKTSMYFNKSKNGKLLLGMGVIVVLLLFSQVGLKMFNPEFLLPLVGMVGFYFLIFYFYGKHASKKLESGRMPVEKSEGVVNAFYDEGLVERTASMEHGAAVQQAMRFAGMNSADYAYVVQVGEKKFYCSKDIHDAFESGRAYSVYFVRAAKREYGKIISGVIVSAEVLQGISSH